MQTNKSSVPQPDPRASGHPRAGQPYNFSHLLQGVFVPRVVMACTLICPGARLLWGLLRVYSRKHGTAFVSEATLAQRLGVSVRHVRRYCGQLEVAGLMRTTPRPGRTPLRELLWAPIFDGSTAWQTPDGSVRGGGHKGPGGRTDMSAEVLKLSGKLKGSSSSDTSGVENPLERHDDDDDAPQELKPYPTRAERAIAHGYFQVMLAWPKQDLTRAIVAELKQRDVVVAEYLSVMWEAVKHLKSPPRPGIWLKIARESEPGS